MKLRRSIGYWGPVVVWMAVIFVVSAQTRLPRFAVPVVNLLSDKGLHMLEYAILGALCYRAVAHTVATRNPALWALGISVLYSISDELHQYFVPGRHSDPADLAADAIGALLGVTVSYFVALQFHEKRAEGTPIE